jgi:hypothetical protein
VNASALPKVRVNGDEFLAWPQPAIVRCERKGAGTTESPIVQDGETALDPPGISVSVAASLGS